MVALQKAVISSDFSLFPFFLDLLPPGTHGCRALTIGAASYLAMDKPSLGPTGSLWWDHMAPPGNPLGWDQDKPGSSPNPTKPEVVLVLPKYAPLPHGYWKRISTPGKLPLFTELPGKQFQNSHLQVETDTTFISNKRQETVQLSGRWPWSPAHLAKHTDNTPQKYLSAPTESLLSVSTLIGQKKSC